MKDGTIGIDKKPDGNVVSLSLAASYLAGIGSPKREKAKSISCSLNFEFHMDAALPLNVAPARQLLNLPLGGRSTDCE